MSRPTGKLPVGCMHDPRYRRINPTIVDFEKLVNPFHHISPPKSKDETIKYLYDKIKGDPLICKNLVQTKFK